MPEPESGRPTAARITVEDLETGKTEVTLLPDGDYLLIVTAPARVASHQSYEDGRVVLLTIKDRTP